MSNRVAFAPSLRFAAETPGVRASRRVVLGAALLVVAAIATAPAAWLDRLLAQRTQQRIRLADSSGFWWRGHGDLTSAEGGARMPIAWRLHFAPLLRGRLAVEFERTADPRAMTGAFEMGRDAVDARDLAFRAPAALVSAFIPASRAIAWGGDVSVQAPSLSWREGRLLGTLDARWQHAHVSGGPLAVNLGNVALAIGSTIPVADGQRSTSNRTASGTLRNDGGDVAIEGTLSTRDDALEALVSLTPRATAPEAIRQALPLLGTPNGAGGVTLTWRSVR